MSGRSPWGLTAWCWWARAFAIASLVHITLPDFDQAGWGWPALVEGVGALWLLVRPHPMAFALCAAGTAWTLIGLNDVLTQSMYLTWVALVALVGALWGRERNALTAIRGLTAATYLLAALHKINHDYLNPEISCAVHAWDVTVEYFRLPEVSRTLDPIMPVLSIALELALAWLIWRGHPLRWVIGAVFHAPLTVTLAPAFAAVTMSGYVAGASPREAVMWRRLLSRPTLLIVAGIITATATALGHGEIRWDHAPKMATLGALAAGGLVIAFEGRPRWPRRLSPAAWVITGLWLAHGLTPYFGLQYQHTAAMLSNMRIDTACHNSLIFPAGLVEPDPYLRIDAADFGGGQRPKRSAKLRAGLWSPTALHTMARNWCVPHLRPITLEGTWRGQPFSIPDLCDPSWPLHVPTAGLWPSADTLPRYITLQKNLTRRCQTACIH
ncbi:MAG: hypothetical protein ACE366_15315 [Bradymonadia bacterium]